MNTQGLRNVHRRQTVFNLLKQRKYDIIFLQETHWTDDINLEILREWGGNIIFNNFAHNVKGNAVLFHPNFDYQNHNTTCDSQGRTIQVVIEDANHKFNLINTYAPRTNIERKYYFATICNFLSATEENILGGDLNCISDNKLDKLGGNPNVRQSATTILHTITQQHNMTDIWRDRNRDIRKYTWTGKNPQDNTFIHTRIDRFYISFTLTTFVTNTDIIPFAFYGKPIVAIFNNLVYIQFSIYIYVIFYYFSI